MRALDVKVCDYIESRGTHFIFVEQRLPRTVSSTSSTLKKGRARKTTTCRRLVGMNVRPPQNVPPPRLLLLPSGCVFSPKRIHVDKRESPSPMGDTCGDFGGS